ncbi:hypothetical protein [Yoonia sp.]|uniref:hypothetical protein n=1 Tax=Yoonia sp. TaxID=2212373 RepID=UPI00358ED353
MAKTRALQNNHQIDFHVTTTLESNTLPIGTAITLPPFQKMFSIGYDISVAPLFCTPDSSAFGAEIGWFRALGLPVTLYGGPPRTLGELIVKPKMWSVVLIDCASYGGMGTVLSDLKMAIPSNLQLPVVLISGNHQPPLHWNPVLNEWPTALDCSFSLDHLEDILDAVLDPATKLNKSYRTF